MGGWPPPSSTDPGGRPVLRGILIVVVLSVPTHQPPPFARSSSWRLADDPSNSVAQGSVTNGRSSDWLPRCRNGRRNWSVGAGFRHPPHRWPRAQLADGRDFWRARQPVARLSADHGHRWRMCLDLAVCTYIRVSTDRSDPIAGQLARHRANRVVSSFAVAESFFDTLAFAQVMFVFSFLQLADAAIFVSVRREEKALGREV